ncbi:hypothetical protein M6B38_222655 [Iris pallida]|uniref:Uncharacterized protein n=1 Tax=Iris pallida TaxID=29817 RepID=A0AAX6DWN1_IRIPA|nr:hypothetical protein M6B38_222655 [Iris pallida]
MKKNQNLSRNLDSPALTSALKKKSQPLLLLSFSFSLSPPALRSRTPLSPLLFRRYNALLSRHSSSWFSPGLSSPSFLLLPPSKP